MPSIEIICVGQESPSKLPEYLFAVVSEPDLESHRGPSSLFQKDFDKIAGCIYHLGGEHLKLPENADKVYFAAGMIIHEFWKWLQFNHKYRKQIDQLLRQLLADSPKHQVIFTSDYQFGPKAKRYKRSVSLSEFWRKHNRRKLPMNSLIVISSN
ncbi:MAG: hypothetical protein JST12_19135 [Armatimonadetes bacterium]|nr:hypothetical protein [Armatimonadota bacterium]